MGKGIVGRTVTFGEDDAEEGEVLACAWADHRNSDDAPAWGFWLLVMDAEGELHDIEAGDCTVLDEEEESK